MKASDGVSVSVHIVEGPLGEAVSWTPPTGQGAVLTFEGVARPTEEGKPIVALDYEAYEPMASAMIGRIGEELVARHGLGAMCVEHSTGRVPAGACSFRLRIASRHRREALAATEEFIDRLKRDVPIWKRAAWS